MIRICKRCHHANPPDATYCFHDGVLLSNNLGGSGAFNVGTLPFTVHPLCRHIP
jgi:hypothetical protein